MKNVIKCSLRNVANFFTIFLLVSAGTIWASSTSTASIHPFYSICKAYSESAWDGSFAMWTQGSGTETDPYLIESAANLYALALMVNQGNSYPDTYFILTTNVSLENRSWAVIGKDYDFSGHFEGAGHSISNITGQLFGTISNATIKNLSININRTSAAAMIGGIIMYAKNSEISRCYAYGEININSTTTEYIGGIVAKAETCNIYHCGNNANIHLTNNSHLSEEICAGIVATATSTNVHSCYNRGDISLTDRENFGGYRFCYGIGGAKCIMCYNTGFIQTSVGSNSYTSRSANAIACGIGGTSNEYCYNVGTVTALDTDKDFNCNVAGGIVADITRTYTCKCCYNVGAISAYWKGGIGAIMDVNQTAYNGTNCYAKGSTYDDNFFKSPGMCSLLNTDSAVYHDDIGINSGYPIFSWMNESPTYTISLNSIHGTVDGAGTYSEGESVIITATPSEGYEFSHWSDGHKGNPRTIIVTQDETYTAYCIKHLDTDSLVFVSHQNGSTIGLVSLASHQTIEYSTNGINWNTLTTTAPITLNDGEMVYMRGILEDNNTTSDYTKFSMTGAIAAYGNINYLWNYQDLGMPLKKYCGASLFRGCVALLKAPELPCTELSDYCYIRMFNGCSSLGSAPELPAMVVTDHSYCNMFRDCAMLTSAPELPATTLAISCYVSMFQGCTNLVSAPAILPAETMVDYCYQSMFEGTSISAAPELPATVLAIRCYNGMFRSCPKLNYINCLATDISATDCTGNWVDGVAPNGTFVKNSLMDSWTTGNDGIPNGWTTQNYAVPNKYTVTFIDWNATILKTEQVVEGTEAHAPTNPTRDGYTFTGWDKDFSNITSDLIVIAQYEEGQQIQYEILFTNSQDKSEIDREYVNLILPNAPEIVGFTFIGWRPVASIIVGNTLEIEAVYEADVPLSIPTEVSIPSNEAQKLIRDGNVYVLRGDKTYTLTGQEVK